MERPMFFLFIALVLVPGSSYAKDKVDILTELRHGQQQVLKRIEYLKRTVTEVRHGQQEVVKQIEEMKATNPNMPGRTAVAGHAAKGSGNFAPVFEYTTVVNQQAEKKLYLKMSTKKKLVQLSLTDKMEAPVIREIPFEISSLAYDSTAHSLLWLSKVNKSAGRFDSHYIPKAVWHFPKSPIQFTIDQENRILYLVNKVELETINLETGKQERIQKLRNKHVYAEEGKEIKMFANSHKRSVLLLVRRYFRDAVVEMDKKRHKIMILHVPLRNAVFLQEGQEFLFCDTKQQLVSFSLKTRKKRTMRLKCPPQVVRLLYYKGTLCAITPDRVYAAQIGEGNLTKQLPSRMTPLVVDKDMLSPIAELMEM